MNKLMIASVMGIHLMNSRVSGKKAGFSSNDDCFGILIPKRFKNSKSVGLSFEL